MITVKNVQVLRSLLSKTYHPLLIEIILDVVFIARDVVITEGWREGGGVHSTDPCRGIDLRSWIYPHSLLDKIETYVNTRWIYDPARPEMKCLVVHNVGKGEHIHVQASDKTVKA